MNVPEELRFAESHEWIETGEEAARVGISDHAQSELSDVVYVELPEVGLQVSAGDAVAVVESVKAASDIYTPVAGEVIAVNERLEDEPETVNADPYNDGWFYKLKPSDTSELDALLSAEDYQAQCAEDS